MSLVPDVLKDYLKGIGRSALAFSGGVDSTYLLHACAESGADAVPFMVIGDFQTVREVERARRLAEHIGMDLVEIRVDVLSDPLIVSNGPDRCYHCKRRVFSSILECADGRILMDGTNASDDVDGRPGMRAVSEMGVLSPLRACGITKSDVRRLSKEAGLENWDLPSDSCLATRIPCGTPITKADLERTEAAEAEMRGLGFNDFRVRTTSEGARLETVPSQSGLLDAKRPEAEKILLKYYATVSYGTRTPQR